MHGKLDGGRLPQRTTGAGLFVIDGAQVKLRNSFGILARIRKYSKNDRLKDARSCDLAPAPRQYCQHAAGRTRNYLGQDLDCHPRQSDRTERKRQHDFDVGFDLRFKVSGENAHIFGRIA